MYLEFHFHLVFVLSELTLISYDVLISEMSYMFENQLKVMKTVRIDKF